MKVRVGVQPPTRNPSPAVRRHYSGEQFPLARPRISLSPAMSARRRISLSPAAGSKRSREPETMEEAWRLHCKYSIAGSRRAAWKYVHSRYMPPLLRDFAVGGRYYEDDPPLKPMSGGDFEKWRSEIGRAHV